MTVRDRPSAAAAANAVDLTAVSFRRAAGTAVTHGEERSEGVAFRWGWAAIFEALGGDRSTDALRDHLRDVDNPLTLVDACFHVIARLHR